MSVFSDCHFHRNVVLVGGSLFSLGFAGAQQRDNRPNIVFILMDDMGYGDIGVYGQLKTETPNIDRLREEGMLFTQSYSGSPVSAPSRCVLMTGMHSGHAQIRGNDEMKERGDVMDYQAVFDDPRLEGQFPLKARTMTIPRMAQQAGYTTGCFGKWGLGNPESDGAPEKQGVDEFFGYNCQRQAHSYYPPFLYHNGERIYLDNKVIDPHKEFLDEGADPYDPASYEKFKQNEYANDLIFDRLLSFVDANKTNPFLLFWTTPIPHVSLQAPDKWVDYYRQKFGDEEPYLGQAGGYYPCRWPHATYAAMLSYFDEQVGTLVEKLKQEGLYDNTLIIFSSDNGPGFTGGSDGPWFNSGGLFRSEKGRGKAFLYEGGIRVSMLYFWKGVIPAGSTTDHICSFQDIMPTLADVMRIKSPKTDGISFYPTLVGRGHQKKHPFLYWEFPDQGGQKAVRYGKWKGLLTQIKAGNSKMMLFDLEQDIREENDVAGEHPEIVRKITRYMKRSSTIPENTHFLL